MAGWSCCILLGEIVLYCRVECVYSTFVAPEVPGGTTPTFSVMEHWIALLTASAREAMIRRCGGVQIHHDSKKTHQHYLQF